MARYTAQSQFRHDDPASLGVLIYNLGTPSAPTPGAVRRFLAEFLRDPRVVEMSRPLWWLILHGVILRFRPRKVASLYQSIWTENGSPLLQISTRQRAGVEQTLRERLPGPVEIALGMRYGEPSLGSALHELREKGARRIVVLPLFPQYSATTTASGFDEINRVLRTWRWLPELRFVSHYHDDPGYINAVAASLQRSLENDGQPDRILFSFHGIPKRYFEAGDPYFCQCQKTARLAAGAAGLSADQWDVSFQSRLGREEWLRPYTDEILAEWAGRGIRSVAVICPGFSADCLETLEEIKIQNRKLFLAAGGEHFRYIPALNDDPEHIRALTGVIARHVSGWPESSPHYDTEAARAEAAQRRERARAVGADS